MSCLHVGNFMCFYVFLFNAEQPTATVPYERTWYDDYDDYGMSTCTLTLPREIYQISKCFLLGPQAES